MTELPLFYRSPVPLDRSKHGEYGLIKDFGLGFCSNANAVPINLIEMPQVCHVYPIVFSPDGNATPVAILGLRDNENLFTDRTGGWRSGVYIPAYIRRYPFIFSEGPDTDNLTLCVDFVPEVVTHHGEHPFFDPTGEPSDLSRNALEFCKSYHAAAQQTLSFSQRIAALDILIERPAQLEVRKDKSINFSGFRIVDEEQFRQLPEEEIVALWREGFLSFIYAHLFSGSQWQRLSALMAARFSSEEEDGDPLTRTVREINSILTRQARR